MGISRSMMMFCFALMTAAMLLPKSVKSQELPTTQVLADGKTLEDVRLQPPKDLNGYFPFIVPKTEAEWHQRRADIQQRILVSTGLVPMPPKTELNAVVHGKIERDGFSVEKVYFEAMPGFYVTGMLYRPLGKGDGPFPAVLCPHGHGGRFMDVGERVHDQIKKGEEKYPESGRFAKLSRCATLARMECVVLIYDMIGYADSQQLSKALAHGYGKVRPEMERDPNHPENGWGLFTAQAEMRLQSIMGIQTWSSIRCLDFLESLPEVDKSRIGVTGGSGGGTQTILLCAIDDRPIVAFPQGMVSTSMQGGCTCENTSLLRIGTGNVELAAVFAPKPQAMTAANDWTKEMMTKGYPELRELYTMLGKPENVDCEAMLQFPHNYNYVTRAMMYNWFNEHMKLGLESPVVEEDYKLLTLEQMAVWNDEHPAPKEKDKALERKLTQQMTDMSNDGLPSISSVDEKSLKSYEEFTGSALRTLIGRDLASVGAIERENIAKIEKKNYWYFKDLLTVTDHGEMLPVVSVYPKSTPWNGRVVIWADGNGKASLFQKDGTPIESVRKLLDHGDAVIIADLFAQGEFVSDSLPSDRNRVVKNPREFAGYTYTYNHTLYAQRVHDVLTLIHWVNTDDHPVKEIAVVGTNGAAPIAAAASALSGDVVSALAVDVNGFRFEDITDYKHPHFQPGIVKYGGVDALLAMNAHKQVLVIDENECPETTKKAFDITGKDHMKWVSDSKAPLTVLTNWLTVD